MAILVVELLKFNGSYDPSIVWKMGRSDGKRL
jgi:hypothetical protein